MGSPESLQHTSHRAARSRGPRHTERWLAAMLLAGMASAAAAITIGSLEPVGVATLAPGERHASTWVGGLSGLVADPEREVLYAISDDAGAHGRPRFYTLRVDLGDGRLDEGDLEVVGVTELRDVEGKPFARGVLDPEGIALSGRGTLFISSEGNAGEGVAPEVLEVGLDGKVRRRLPAPPAYVPGPGRGTRHNLGFESLTSTPGGERLWTGTENALVQDGPEATVAAGSPVRLLAFEATSGAVVAEHLYPVEAVAAPAEEPDGLEVAGLVELLALGEGRLLALERSFSTGAGNRIRLYRVELAGATDVAGRVSLAEGGAVRPVRKRLLADLGAIGVELDNLEGLAFGPRLPDGRRTLLMISDDNFNPALQVTQLLAFAVGEAAVSVPGVQGRGHRSPLAGSWVVDVPGVVSAVAATAELEVDQRGFWMEAEAGDGDPATSDGIFVATGELSVAPGDRVRVTGRVLEHAPDHDTLPVTRLAVSEPAGQLERVAGGSPPPPTRLGRSGRRLPGVVLDDDALGAFDPHGDGIDFWESLEGMAVEVLDPVVTGPTRRYGEIAVLADGGQDAFPRSLRGGVVRRPGDPNPERILLEPRLGPEPPALGVGDRFDGSVVGVVDAAYGAYRVIPTAALPPVALAPPVSETTALSGDGEALTLATYNVLNLDPGDDAEKLAALAQVIVREMAAPDVVALQEIQDASGPADDGVVAGGPTLEALIAAIVAAGGPRYRYRQIDPVDGDTGGEPGGNIRVAYLFDPERVRFVDRGAAGPGDAVGVEVEDGTARLTLSPGYLDPDHPAFAGDPERGWGPSRRALAATIRFRGRRLTLVNAHLTSKGGDDPLAGARQPPRPVTEDRRSRQARRIAALVDEILGAEPDARVVVLGDLNEHELRPPLAELAAVGLVDLVEALPVAERYSYVYRGNAQVLDHVLVSSGLLDEARVRIDAVHVHADLPDAHRPSDHDPLLVEIDFNGGSR